ncbi:hypothetical protein AB1Y20_021504 [Prymnesium parvum]|uniref:peptidylprolyl isomerase n=1 Tax=Prymnesium parvum TaxID=97485 RepID=A0AB34JJQ8_PRYPA
MAAPALLLPLAQAIVIPRALARREVVAAAAGALVATLPPLPAAYASMSGAELDALDLASREAEGILLPSGVRLIEVVEGTGPLPSKGSRVYCHFKVWTKGFQSGVPVDSSFIQTRPYSWFLGQSDERIKPGFDEGTLGMREGGWRRLVVPAALAYGQSGLPKGTRGAYLVPPNTDVYVDLRMMDGGSGRCDALLRPPGVSEKGAARLKSISCVLGAP